MTDGARNNSDIVLSQESYILLAQANLMRVRGQWDDAVERCTEAMKRDPDNASVPSMLGDIYENQGRLDEAIRWYRLALDKNPESPADQLKLRRVLEESERKVVAGTANLISTDSSNWGIVAEEQSNRFSSFNHKTLTIVLRAAAYALAAAFAIVVATGLTSPASHARFALPPTDYHSLQTDPVLLQDNSSSPQQSINSGSPRDASEANLLSSLLSDSSLTGHGITVSDLSDDPRAGQITVTAQYLPGDTQQLSRADIMRAALRVAFETSARTDSASAGTFTVRVILRDATTQTDKLTFTGDVIRTTLIATSGQMDTLSDDEVTSHFINPWWSPDFAS